MNQGTNLGSQIGRWIILAAVVALLGALLLTIRPVVAQDAPPLIPNAETEFTYAENGTGSVTTYRATDPEGNKIFWTLEGTDAADFKIDGGVLSFKNPPNYENPTDRVRLAVAATNTDPAITAETGVDNIYRVTVRIGAGGQDGTPNPTDDYDGDDLGKLDLTITVTNLDELGGVLISSLQPQVGTELTATVFDLDGVAGVGSWQWARSDSMNGTFEDIPERSSDDTYTPTIDDLDKYLQVTAQYRDNVSGADIREKEKVSAYAVRKDTVSSNAPPMFPDQRTLGLAADNGSFVRADTERFIHEGSKAGTLVGAPVTAIDDATAIDVLTYSLSNTTAASGHASKFSIDEKTGQITLSANGVRALDAEAVIGDPGHPLTPYEVTVRATDGDGHRGDIDVEIWVVDVNEPPKITGVVREMSHYEARRNDSATVYMESPALQIDTDLDTLVDTTIEPATYMASDPEDGATNLTWSLEGDDGWLFAIPEGPATVDPAMATATLWFKNRAQLEETHPNSQVLDDYPNFPDFDNERDANKDNVYEVTLVVTDILGKTGTYNVTVKVINSTEDNKAGKVTILNRQPEVNTALATTFGDPDKPTEVKWQWYRLATDGQSQATRCADYNPHADPDTAASTLVRGFLVPGAFDASDGPWFNWEAIGGATSASYTPGYNEDSGGEVVVNATANTATWTGGDIDVVIATPEDDDKSYAWTNPRCLRVVVTYRDDVDPTNPNPDDLDTAMDETLEGTYMGSEYPVKRLDEKNKAPKFTSDSTYTGTDASTYRAERREDTTRAAITDGNPNTIQIGEALAAVDVVVDPATNVLEDDDTNDTLTYSLSGTDAKHFVIVGSVQHPMGYNLDGSVDGALELTDDAGQGALIITDGLDLDGLDFERKKTYQVTITATDPSGEKDSVTVNVIITDLNEGPDWVMGKAPERPDHEENDTSVVATYKAKDPEGSGIIYSLPTVSTEVEEDPDGEADTGDEIGPLDYADSALLKINLLDGTLSFKSPPNYEKPKDGLDANGERDAATDNMYKVVVKATVVDSPDETPPHATYRKVTVIVRNVNEAPVFPKTTDTLEIKENADDPQKEQPATEEPLYLLNRGVGKPSPTLPAAPDLDVGVPVVAADDDSTGNFAVGPYFPVPTDDNDNGRDRIDGLTYTLSGADAAHFHIVPATGQILTLEKLNYEIKNEYKVTVKATDPDGESDSIPITIKVTDVEEVPVTEALVLRGADFHTYEENGTDAVGEYEVGSFGGATANPTWTLEGADMSHFTLTGSGNTRMLEFTSSPDYDMPRGQAMSDTNTNTYEVTLKVTDPSDSEIVDTLKVRVDVTDVDELGTLSGDDSLTQAENGTDAVGTYRLTGTAADTADWSLDGADMSDFMLEGSGSTRMLKFKTAPDYEMPRGMAMSDDNTNTYMVTVMAEAGGEMDMVEVTVTVTNVDELGTLSGSTSASIMEGATDSLGTYTLTGTAADTADWSLAGADMSDFMLDGTGMSRMLNFRSAPDYETPMGGADADSNTYMVTVMAEAGGEMEMVEVTVTVTNVDELGSLGGPTSASVMEGATDLDTYTLTGGTMDDTATWTLDGDDMSDFMLEGTGMSRMLKFSSAPDFEAPMGGADNDSNTYMVTVMASAGGEMAMQEVTVMVTNMEEAGTVTLDPARPSVGTEITATLADDDIVETVSWQWASADAMDGTFTDISDATSASYTPVEGDAGMYLQATATYDDRYDSGNTAMIVTETAVSQLAVNGDPEVEHPENVTSVATYTASGAASVQWSLLGDDARDFNINGGQLTFRTSPDYEDPADANTDNVYMVTVVARAGTLMASQDVTVTVSNVNEAGTVTLSTMSPAVGSEVTASLTDLDGGITGTTWQWAKSMTMDGTFTDIDTATSMAYTPAEADEGYYLKVTASYTDGEGIGKTATFTSQSAVVGVGAVGPVQTYDTNKDGMIGISELINAINDHFAGRLGIGDLVEVINAHFG